MKIFSSVLVACFLSFSCGVCFSQDDSSSNLGEVEIKGEAKDKVKIKKFLPEIKIHIPDIIDSTTESTEKLLEEGKKGASDDDYKELDYEVSNQTARPYLPDLVEAPLVSFHPEMAKVPVKRWELVITDDKGRTVRTVKGKGNPVKQIYWDGTDSKKEMLKVDSLYSYKFIVYDNLKNPHTTFGKSFKIDAVIYKKKKDTIVEFYNEYLFNKDSSKFSADSRLALAKAVDILRSNSKYPFTIEFYDKDPLSLLVKERQKKLCKHVADEMLLMVEDVRYRVKREENRGRVTRFVIHR